jgi:hypothetical protein
MKMKGISHEEKYNFLIISRSVLLKMKTDENEGHFT